MQAEWSMIILLSCHWCSLSRALHATILNQDFLQLAIGIRNLGQETNSLCIRVHFNPWSIPVDVLGTMLGTRSITAKTRFTAPEALVMSGKACCALATPNAENAMQKNTCTPSDQLIISNQTEYMHMYWHAQNSYSFGGKTGITFTCLALAKASVKQLRQHCHISPIQLQYKISVVGLAGHTPGVQKRILQLHCVASMSTTSRQTRRRHHRQQVYISDSLSCLRLHSRWDCRF